MTLRALSSFIPTADELLTLDLPRLGGILLLHLKSYEGLNTVLQNGRLNRDYFIAMLENRNVGLGPLPHKEPEYGAKQSEVIRALMEAWNWLEREGMLIRDAQQPGPWFVISRRGEELIRQAHRFEQWEKLGVNRVKSDLENTGGIREIGGTQEVRDLAWKWVEMKEAQVRQQFAKRDQAILSVRHAAERGLAPDSKLIFLSHAAVDQSLAAALKRTIEAAMPGVDVFVSTDGEDLRPGDPWVETIQTKLREARLFLILATDRGINRRWVWYEAGAGWSRGLRVIPCCVGQVRKGNLPPPFYGLQALNADDEPDLKTFLTVASEELGLEVQETGLVDVIAELKELDRRAEASVAKEEAAKSRGRAFDETKRRHLVEKLREVMVHEKDLVQWLLIRGEADGQAIHAASLVRAEDCGGALDHLVQLGLLKKRDDTSMAPAYITSYWSVNPEFAEVLRNELFPRPDSDGPPRFGGIQ